MFFGYFPVVTYGKNLVTDLFFRTKFKELVKNNTSVYYYYTVRDSDTPESIALKYYGDAMAHWVILYANDIVDPNYDWLLSSDKFNLYIRDKYGSIEYAKTNIHHYEKVVRSRDTATDVWTETRQVIDMDDARTDQAEDLPYDVYSDMAETFYPNISGTFKNGQSVEIVVSRNAISYFDWETEENEKKRNIRLIKKEYYDQITSEMNAFVNQRRSFFREIRGF